MRTLGAPRGEPAVASSPLPFTILTAHIAFIGRQHLIQIILNLLIAAESETFLSLAQVRHHLLAHGPSEGFRTDRQFCSFPIALEITLLPKSICATFVLCYHQDMNSDRFYIRRPWYYMCGRFVGPRVWWPGARLWLLIVRWVQVMIIRASQRFSILGTLLGSARPGSQPWSLLNCHKCFLTFWYDLWTGADTC